MESRRPFEVCGFFAFFGMTTGAQMRDTTAFKAKQFESEDQRKAVFAALADGGEGETFTAWSKNLIDDVHHRGKSAPARFENVTADELQHFTQMEREICEVHFYPYLTVIKKRGT